MNGDRTETLKILNELPSKSITLNSFISLGENAGESFSGSSPRWTSLVFIEPYFQLKFQLKNKLHQANIASSIHLKTHSYK